MKNKSQTLVILLLLGLSCCKEKICPPNEYIGAYDLQKTVSDSFPYLMYEKAIFKDSLENERTYQIYGFHKGEADRMYITLKSPSKVN